MAVCLESSSNYKIVSKNGQNPNKSLFLVKLTDSCLKTLEQLQNPTVKSKLLKSGATRKPSIQFKNGGKAGTLFIPSKNGVDNNGTRFNFTCANLFMVNSTTGLDCLQQNKGDTNLTLLGNITEKINVSANNDSYAATKNRMAEAEKERQGSRAKVIELGSKNGAIKKKRMMPNARQKFNFRKVNLNNKINPSSSSSIKGLREKVIHLLALRPCNKLELRMKLERVKKQLLDEAEQDIQNNLGQGQCYLLKEIFNQAADNMTSNFFASLLRPAFPARIAMFVLIILTGNLGSYREAFDVIRHTYGVKLKDASVLTNVLQQVSAMQDNVYVLNRHFYTEVQVDTWPGYTDDDRQTIKNKLVTEMGSSVDRLSPGPLIASTLMGNISAKRPLSGENKPGTNPAGKKPRIAHSITPKTEGKRIETSPPKLTSQPPRTVPPRRASREKHKSNHEIKTPNKDSTKTTKTTNGSESAGNDNNNNNCSFSKTDSSLNEDYILKYPEIKTYEERCSYKEDFAKEYTEFTATKERLDLVTKQFNDLKEKLKNYPADSYAAKELQEEIFKVYEEKKEQWTKDRQRLNYLYPKLNHIKKLVIQYDQAHFGTS